MPYTPGQAVEVLHENHWHSGFINTVSPDAPVKYSVRLPAPGKVPNQVVKDVLAVQLRAPTNLEERAREAQQPRLAVPGEYHLGPSRHDDKAEAIHRADLELEMVEGKPYVRLYLSVPTAAVMTNPDPRTGQATSDFKDVQQDPATGQLFITSGKNRMLWVGGGRPLRALKWAEKYIAEHRTLAEAYSQKNTHPEKRAQLPTLIAQHTRDLQSLWGSQPSLERRPTPTTPTAPKSGALGLRKLALLQATKSTQDGYATKQAQHAALNNPVIRTYLFPLDRFNTIVKKAVPEAVLKQFKTAPSFNVDRHYEPNQYGFQEDGLKQLAAHALPYSLITYTYRPHDLPQADRAGEVRDVRELWARLDIPEQKLKSLDIWVTKGEFTDKKKFLTLANTLSLYLATWSDSKKQPHERTRSPLLADRDANIPYYARKTRLDKFLTDHDIDPLDTEQAEVFLRTIVTPWASQAMIAHVIAEDYERINKDENVRAGAPVVHDFLKWQTSAASDRKRLEETGRQLDQMLDARQTPQALINHLISRHPQLQQRYNKISAKSEDYSFYVHAQMVLCQYLKLVEGEKDDARLIPWKLIAKTILFHDMEKVNSKLQYGKEGEHVLTVDELRKHCYVLGTTPAEWKIAISLVDADPFGDYFKGKTSSGTAFQQLHDMALSLGYAYEDMPRFFIEYHQYYQADFSSYTSDSRYRMPNGVLRTGKPVFNGCFKMMGGDKIRMNNQERRYQYSAKDDYEKRYLELKALFAREEDVRERGERLRVEREAAERLWKTQNLANTAPSKRAQHQ
ncbi:hypothetical protein ATI61_106376 [Archangium gephyra]|uniref:Fibroin heavy chain n=1 Tax=Archangium gephyra TaxID=48 RepID=A0AAC8Q112_9BACT|nr:hypothetical protein [Archangium gephyra]AKI98997.1 Fibroin heavy chain precursor [Archangium gephyra]REG30906.1 hypothetical protein ATI61_106376 [Archangium gephyra]